MKHLLSLLALLPFLAGCASHSIITPALVRQGVATGVAYSTHKYPTAVPYVQIANEVVCSAAHGTNISPAVIVTQIEATGVQFKTPEAVLIINTALLMYTAVWNGYGQPAVTDYPQLQQFLSATCDGIHDGLGLLTQPSRFAAKPTAPIVWPYVRF